MYFSENIFGIDGLHDIGTVFFLIAIISLSMKKFMNKNNWTMRANHCLKIVSHGGIRKGFSVDQDQSKKKSFPTRLQKIYKSYI